MNQSDVKKIILDLYQRGRTFEGLSENTFNCDEFKNYIHDVRELIKHPDPNLQKIGALAQRLNSPWTPRKFLDLLVPIERLAQRQISEDEFLIHDHPDKKNNDLQKNEYPSQINKSAENAKQIVVIADHIRSAFNVGALFRCADAFAVEKIILTGYTPSPESNSTISKTALGSQDFIFWEHIENTLDAIKKLKAEGYSIFALETTQNAKNINHVEWPDKIALLLGNERFGLNPEILSACDEFVKINMMGQKNSLNVATAFAIVAYEIQSRQ